MTMRLIARFVARDEAAFDAHIDSAHSLAFNRRLRELVVGGTSAVEWLTPLAATAITPAR